MIKWTDRWSATKRFHSSRSGHIRVIILAEEVVNQELLQGDVHGIADRINDGTCAFADWICAFADGTCASLMGTYA